MKHIILFMILLVKIKADCDSLPLASSSVNICNKNTGNCNITFSSLTSVNSDENSQICFNINPFQIGDSNYTSESSFNIAILENHCDIPLYFNSYRADTEIFAVLSDMGCPSLGDSIEGDNDDITGCGNIPFNSEASVCMVTPGFSKGCYGDGNGRSRDFASNVVFNTKKRWLLFNSGPGLRHLTIGMQDLSNGSLSSAQATVISWDGVSASSTKAYGNFTVNLISDSSYICPDYSSKYIVIDTYNPFDAYVVDQAIFNDVGSSFSNLMGPISWDDSANQTFRFNPDQIKNGIIITAVSFPDNIANAQYNGDDECEYFENLRINKQGLKSQYPYVFYSNSNDKYQTQEFSSGNTAFSHISRQDLSRHRYDDPNKLLNKSSYANVVDINNDIVEIGYYYPQLTQQLSCYMIQKALFIVSGVVNVLIEGGSYQEIYCNPSPSGNKWVFSAGTNTEVSQFGSINVINENGGISPLYLYSDSYLFLNFTASNPIFNMRLITAINGQILVNVLTNQNVAWDESSCCPYVNSLTDDPDNRQIIINARSNCDDGSALATENGGQTADAPQDFYLTSYDTDYSYKREFDVNGTITIKLCCGTNCSPPKSLQLSNLPAISELNTSDTQGPVTNSNTRFGYSTSFQNSDGKYCGSTLFIIYFCTKSQVTNYILCIQPLEDNTWSNLAYNLGNIMFNGLKFVAYFIIDLVVLVTTGYILFYIISGIIYLAVSAYKYEKYGQHISKFNLFSYLKWNKKKSAMKNKAEIGKYKKDDDFENKRKSKNVNMEEELSPSAKRRASAVNNNRPDS